MTQDATTGRMGRPARTSRDEILRAARIVIDRDGWQKLTIRALGKELGVGAATIYHHVRDREDLLIQLLVEHAGRSIDVSLPEEPEARILAAAVAIRDTLAALPWATEVLATDGFLARLGGRAVQMVEAIVATAIAAGASQEDAVALFRNIWYLTVGEIQVRARTDSRPEARDARASRFADLDAEATPALASIGEQWVAWAAHDTYADGVASIIAGTLRRSG